MSTRMSREYIEGKLHLYEDLMDPGAMFVQLAGEYFEATPNSCTLRIPADLWDKIRDKEIIQLADFWKDEGTDG